MSKPFKRYLGYELLDISPIRQAGGGGTIELSGSDAGLLQTVINKYLGTHTRG